MPEGDFDGVAIGSGPSGPSLWRPMPGAPSDRWRRCRPRRWMPDRKVSDEMWPSPTARRLRMKRHAAFGGASLVGMPHDAGIEQSRRFERVFVQKIGADQAALRPAQLGCAARAPVPSPPRAPRRSRADCGGGPRNSPARRPAAAPPSSGAERQHPVDDMVGARSCRSDCRSRGSVAGLNGRTTTRAGSGRR